MQLVFSFSLLSHTTDKSAPAALQTSQSRFMIPVSYTHLDIIRTSVDDNAAVSGTDFRPTADGNRGTRPDGARVMLAAAENTVSYYAAIDKDGCCTRDIDTRAPAAAVDIICPASAYGCLLYTSRCV